MPVVTPAPQPTVVTTAARLDSIDLLRGWIMVFMALDHTRDFFHALTIHGVDPLDLAKTSPALFFTRWITHYCAPIFSFLAGTGVCLSVLRGKSLRELSWFLVTRGAWLIFLELTLLMWFGWRFAFTPQSYTFATLWSLGWSMIVLAGLIHLPMRVIAGFSLVLILGHNAFDRVLPASWGGAAWLWQVLHAGGAIETVPGFRFYAFYPLIPWLGIMAAGYCFGRLYALDAAVRRVWLVRLGAGLVAAFILLRWSNLYGDPAVWSSQASAGLTLLSFLDCEKYPPSLCYTLMTLGPGLLLLAWCERGTPAWMKPVLVFGRVPFLYYILHIPLIHGLAYLMHFIRHGRGDVSGLRSAAPPPADAGLNLFLTYLVWIGIVLLLYPVCRWFADYKRRHRDNAWLSYF